MPFILLMFSFACSTTSVELAEDCDVQLRAISPESAPSGTEVVARVRPVTAVWDTAVYMGSHRALVTAVDRTNCTECDSCRTSEGCTVCEDCDACDAQCDRDCIETVSFETTGETGSHAVSLFNGYGQSNALPFFIESIANDSGTLTDTGAADSGEASVGSDTGPESEDVDDSTGD